MLGSITTATLTVLNVWCASGAPVNFEVTAKIGQRYPVTDEDRAAIEAVPTDTWTLDVPMTVDRRSYANGRPPCPVGDVLHVQFQKFTGS